MNAIPARVAGVGELIMVVPTPAGEQNPLVLAAAALVGVDRVFTIGGAQAVAALAYGTQTVPPVDKIVGPVSYTHLDVYKRQHQPRRSPGRKHGTRFRAGSPAALR